MYLDAARRHRRRHRAAGQPLALVAPAARLRAALALDGDLAQHHRARPHQRRVPGVLAVSAGGRSGRARPASGWSSTSARSARTRWRSRPSRCTVNGADTIYTGRQYVGAGAARHRAHRHRHLQRRDRRHRHSGRSTRHHPGGRAGTRGAGLPLCSRSPDQRRADLSLGRPERALHQRQRRARHRGPERRHGPRPHRHQRERLPLRREPRGRQRSSCETA